MKSLSIAFVSIGLAAAAVNPANGHLPGDPPVKESHVSYIVEPGKSEFAWTARKVSGQHSGTISISAGNVTFNKGMLLGGMFELDMNTIANTDIDSEGMKKKLEGHLKSEDFFNVGEFPKADLKVKLWAPIKDAKEGAANYYVKGDLTIKGITHEISFAARVDLSEKQLTASADFDIDRTLYDVRYNSGKFFPEIGDRMIEDLFNVKIKLVASAK